MIRMSSSLLDYPGPCPHCGSDEGYYVDETVIYKVSKNGGVKAVNSRGCFNRVCANCEEEV